ncbi:MAG: sulfurtransferase [Desulfovibrionales bacterium]
MLIDRRKNHRRRGQVPFGFGRIKWVTTKWLEEHLEDENLSILDVQPDVRDYIKAHIRGAVYMSEKLLRISVGGIPGKWISPEAAQSEFRRLGLTPSKPVVIYTGTGEYRGWGDGLDQFMVAYSLARFGHEKVLLLDGGFDRWIKEGRPINLTFPEIKETDFPIQVQKEMFVDSKEFKNLVAWEDALIVDARPEHYYAGEGPWLRNGHVPGAVSLPWQELVEDNNPSKLKEEDKLFKTIDRIGIHDEIPIICMSGTGREATVLYTILKHYFDFATVKLYEGSFTEWIANPSNPVLLGTEPR